MSAMIVPISATMQRHLLNVETERDGLCTVEVCCDRPRVVVVSVETDVDDLVVIFDVRSR